MLVSHAIRYASLAGVTSHLVFKRREPRILPFLSALAIGTLSVFSYDYLLNDSPTVLRGIVVAMASLSTFLASLSASIIVYRLSPWHPLAEHPGPPLAKISKWWMSYRVGRGNRHLVFSELHKRYGAWLRVGPNEISVNVPAAIRPIYSQMFRSRFYQGAPQPGDSLVTTVDRAKHASRLIAWNKAFSADSLRNFRPLVQNRTTQLLEIFQDSSRDGSSIDLSHWISLWALDIMGDMAFSGGFETMTAGKDSEGFLELIRMGSFFIGIFGQVPWMRDIFSLLPVSGVGATFSEFAGRKAREANQKSSGMKRDILGIVQDDSSGGPLLSEDEAAADAAFIVVAGADTVAQAATALLRHIITDEGVQTRLRAEVRAAFDGAVEDMDAQALARLPYLDACVQEALRIVPPVPIGVPRVSSVQGCRVLDRFVPPGTTVGCPTYTLHHDPENFADPERFWPERWLPGNVVRPHNMEAFIPFSYGLGVCIGKPVALHNLKLLTASLMRTFQLSIPPGVDIRKFDDSYKDHNLWVHGALLTSLKPL